MKKGKSGVGVLIGKEGDKASCKYQSSCGHYLEERGELLFCPHNSRIKTEEYCDVGIEIMKRHEIKVEEGQRDKFLRDLRCSKCGSGRLE